MDRQAILSGIRLCIHNILIKYALGLFKFSLLQSITFVFVRSVRQFFYQFSNLLADLFFHSHRQIIRSLYRMERAVFKKFWYIAFLHPFQSMKKV